ncbi:flagellar hook-basal body complex protein FliE [Alicyclobacillus sp. SP_1]|jgi:flagellar hook-basal body complex protein FliE|uniref:flagellar hook-basal body complex protein FliE n=1 Tax=Alicyclobacillus sp. SP_1 TaxID=2942475 RepID=UPI0021576B0A|nr:flagellar hook-basal body complex protein FliE [Alicyclobacillus sp. SP_1]
MSAILPFSLSTSLSSTALTTRHSSNSSAGNSFLQYLQNSLSQVNQLSQKADKAAMSYAMGGPVSIDQVMVAEQKATLALDTMVQVRNRVVSAYDSIMNMQM